ncbi:MULTISPECIES: hypothetical protein [unclassified Mesorhizobium]|uniref:hypothetical protein n=1 Tax=unclassified Mesorhizobium TaxID=325217 RepID=UPI00143F0BD5|nr:MULTISPECIES: hypothetical protein [unclassified Mesorhizobium]
MNCPNKAEAKHVKAGQQSHKNREPDQRRGGGQQQAEGRTMGQHRGGGRKGGQS